MPGFIFRNKNRSFDIVGAGKGEGLYHVSIGELHMLKLDIENIILNDEIESKSSCFSHLFKEGESKNG